MFKAVLFDLDGTLLPFNLEIFLPKYLQALGSFFAFKVDPHVFIEKLQYATSVMMKNDGSKINEELFMETFLEGIKQEKEVMYPYFKKFYEEIFPDLQQYTGFTPLAASVVGQVLQKGCKIVLATNPVFPKTAVLHRMKWAEIDSYPWSYITTYENSRSCKPSLLYYQNICEQLKIDPQECLMVGNDVKEDLAARDLGIKTYLVTDHLIDRGIDNYYTDYQGTISELYQFVKNFDVLKLQNSLIK